MNDDTRPARAATDDQTIDTDTVILIVVGAHLRAEIHDRPLAGALRGRMLDWLDDRFGPRADGCHPCAVVLCTDVWYLNDASLRSRPAVTVGGIGVNAATAHLADKLPGAYVIDDVLMVQCDPAFDEPLAACWGVDAESTRTAVDAFAERYLDSFMTAATRPWE